MHNTDSRYAPLIFIAGTVLLVAVIILGGYQSFRHQKESMKQEIHKDLNTIADLKTNQIVQWRSERFGDASAIGENIIIAHNVEQLIDQPKNIRLREDILSWMAVTQKNYQYQRAWITTTIAGLLVILVISIGSFFRRRQLGNFHKKQYEAELERYALLQHYEYLTKYANDIIILVNEKGNILEINERAALTYGYTREELLRMRMRELRAPETRADINALDKMVREQDGRVYETRHIKKDGTVFPVEASTRLIKINDKQYFQSIIRDITIRKNTEKALQESQRALATLISNLPGIAYRCLFDYNITMVYVSQGCRELTGYHPEELVQNRKISFAQLIHTADKKRVFDTTRRAVKAGSPFQVEHRILTSDGQIKWIWGQGRAVYSKQGEILALEGFITDTTEQILAREELAREKEQLAVTLSSIGDAVISVDNFGLVRLINPAAEVLTGWPKNEAIGRPLMEIFHIINETSRLPVENPVEMVFKHGRIVGLANHTALIARDGTERSIADSAAPIRDKDGGILGVILVFRDVTNERQKEAAIKESENRLRQITDNMLDMITQTDINGIFEYASPSHKHVMGYSPEDLLNRPVFDFIHPEDLHVVQLTFQNTVKMCTASRFEYRCRNANSIYLWLESVCNPLRNPKGKVSGVIFGTRDITERKQAEENLQYLAMHDPLTNIPNRYLLEEMLHQAVERAKRGLQSALLFIDLDNFKMVNDTYGHAVGDELLVGVARTLKNNLRAADFVARFGGDEFTVLLEGVTLEQAEKVAKKLLNISDQVEMLLSSHEIKFNLTISMGMIMVDGTVDSRKLLTLVDNALYNAKERGRNRVVLARPDEDIAEALSKTNQLVGLIRSALKENRFTLFLQPVVSISEGKIIHYEALLRLRQENGEIMPPGRFIPVAERFGLMTQLDRWVIKAAINTVREHPGMNLFINLSGTSLGDDTLLDLVESQIKNSNIDPAWIGFEITETTAVKDLVHAERWIKRIKKMGCKFALDDFGTGFSSFSYLRTLPVDYLKIDGSFVKNIDSEENFRAIVQAMNAVSHTLGKKTIAEFVENEKTLNVLKEMGVDYGQGYYLGQPSPKFA